MIEQSTSSLLYEANLLLDRIAERKLHDLLGISYARFIFLLTVQQGNSPTQHQIAQALKISDPAVSKLCAEAVRDGLLQIITNPLHKRQRLVSLTDAGRLLLEDSIAMLDSCFSDICSRGAIDEAAYRDQTARVVDGLAAKYKELMEDL